MVYTPEKGFTGTDELTVTTAEAVKLYAVDTAPIATVGGVDIEGSADGSAIAAVPRSTDEVYGLSDRGANVDGRTDDEKVLPVPDFQPRIDEYKPSDGSATVEKTIGLTGTDGAPLRGLVDPQANTGETLVDINGKPLPTSDHGLDTEGLVALPASTLVGIMQSTLKTPGLEGSAKSVAFTRIVTVSLATKAVGEYLYPLANPQETKVAVSEITALTNTTFLVDERDGKLAPGADGLQVGGKALETAIGVTTDTEAVAALKAKGITTVRKTLKLDLGGLLNELNAKGEFFGHDKVEGLATPDGG
ncbi:MAG: esterase-like of phytase family protein, partial [Mycobacterium sp.]|nr:esterase-like of phytase family protein [Mycobacterium sp.]